MLAAAPVAHFRPAPGWVARRISSEPGMVVAVTVADASVIHPFALFGSLARLRRDGILVWCVTVGRGLPGFPSRRPSPPRLASFRVERGWEGQPSPNVQQRVWVGVVHGWDLDVRVYFGTQSPSVRLRAKAQGELRRLRLP